MEGYLVSILFIHDDVNLDLIFPANLASGLSPESGIAHQVPPATQQLHGSGAKLQVGGVVSNKNGTILEGILRFLILRQPHISRGKKRLGHIPATHSTKKKGDSQESCLNFNVLNLYFRSAQDGFSGFHQQKMSANLGIPDIKFVGTELVVFRCPRWGHWDGWLPKEFVYSKKVGTTQRTKRPVVAANKGL